MKIVIVGGVAGGASAAARARRLSETAEIILLQRDPDVSYASCGTYNTIRVLTSVSEKRKTNHACLLMTFIFFH